MFMSEPKGFVSPHFPSHVCRLKKSFYSLKQAPWAWYTKLRIALQGWGFVRVFSDASLFIKKSTHYVLFILVYVDDILVTGSDPKVLQSFIWDLDIHFALKTLGSVNYFLGFEAHRDKIGIYLTQFKYIIDLLKKSAMQDCKSCFTLVNLGFPRQMKGSYFLILLSIELLLVLFNISHI